MNTSEYGAIVISTMFFLACLAQSASGESSAISLSIEPTSPTFVEGEPVQIVMNFKNEGKQEASVCLGIEGTENLKITVEDERLQQEKAEGKMIAGFRKLVNLHIKPKSTQSNRLILDDLFTVHMPGRYQLTIQVKNTPITSNTAEFQILPADSINTAILKEKYDQLWKTANIHPLGGRDPNQLYALKIIALTRHKVAIDYQKQFVFEEKIHSDHFDIAVASLISTHDPDIIRLLIMKFLDEDSNVTNLRAYVLYSLREAGAHEWDEERYKELAAYREKIANAIPISVDD
jgi:hypothetical protein